MSLQVAPRAFSQRSIKKKSNGAFHVSTSCPSCISSEVHYKKSNGAFQYYTRRSYGNYQTFSMILKIILQNKTSSVSSNCCSINLMRMISTMKLDSKK